MKKIIYLLLITLGLTTLSNAQTNEIKSKGVFKEIDLSRDNEAIKILNSENQKLKLQTVESILKNPNFYNPTVIYALSHELYIQDKKDDAMYWFYLAQLRARYDSNLCMDNTAKQAVSILNNNYGPDINKYAFQNVDKLEITVAKVVDFVRTNEENYDHRWINLHGMDAILTGMSNNAPKKELSLPKERWTEIKKQTIDDYYNGFIKYVKSKKTQ